MRCALSSNIYLCLAAPADRIVTSQVIVTLLGAQPRWARGKKPPATTARGQVSILGAADLWTLRPAVLHGARSVRMGQDRPDTGSVSIAEHEKTPCRGTDRGQATRGWRIP